MTQRLPDGLGIQPVTVRAMLLRMRRRERPILPSRRKIVRRSPHSATRDVKLPVRPEVRSTAISSKRQIVIEADAHAGFACVLLHSRELAVQIPLQPTVEQNLARMT